jgi:hypothetical protein
MNRRELLKGSLTLGALPSLIFVEGCPTQLTLAQEINIVGTTAASIVSSLGQTALAAQLADATAKAVKLVTNWVAGTPTQDIIQALDALLSVIDLIPVATPYEALIAILIGGVEGVLALLPSAGVTANIVRPKLKRSPVTLMEKQFRVQYNKEIPNHPELALHKI